MASVSQTGNRGRTPSKISKGTIGTKASKKSAGKTPGGSKVPPETGKKKTEWSLPPFSILPKKPKEGKPHF